MKRTGDREYKSFKDVEREKKSNIKMKVRHSKRTFLRDMSWREICNE